VSSNLQPLISVNSTPRRAELLQFIINIRGSIMRQSTRQVLIVASILLLATLVFQQCAPTQFTAPPAAGLEKADGLPGDVGEVEITDDPVHGEVPVVNCPKDKRLICKDKFDGEEEVAAASQQVGAKEKCAVLCHVPG